MTHPSGHLHPPPRQGGSEAPGDGPLVTGPLGHLHLPSPAGWLRKPQVTVSLLSSRVPPRGGTGSTQEVLLRVLQQQQVGRRLPEMSSHIYTWRVWVWAPTSVPGGGVGQDLTLSGLRSSVSTELRPPSPDSCTPRTGGQRRNPHTCTQSHTGTLAGQTPAHTVCTHALLSHTYSTSTHREHPCACAHGPTGMLTHMNELAMHLSHDPVQALTCTKPHPAWARPQV